ncbi:unnamed protein product [Caenorhabditis sp. 36 PRJEB53466]|nr:unnamed protein product [Caenorhabditis sp. 36 PRJEB53466]
MSSRQDPRVERLLEKTTLENLFKLYFQRIYGKEEIQEMENALKNALKKYEKKEDVFQKLWDNKENEATPLLNECLDSICEKTFNSGKSHTPESLLTLSKLFIKVGDFRLACEVIWCSASISIQEFIADRQLKVLLHSHNAKRRFASALSRDIGRRFSVFEVCHSSFYTNSHGALDVKDAFGDATEFIQKLRELQITDELKKELEKKNFNI